MLLHGMTGSAESWWRVAERLVAVGHRVLAIDLPGHGLSARDSRLTIDSAARSVVETVHAFAPGERVLAVGHSFGGMVLAAAHDDLRPALAVHVDAPLRLAGGQQRGQLVGFYEESRQQRTVERLRATRPHYSERDVAVEARAAERFDPATAAAVSCGPGGLWLPGPGSIVLRADPSDYVSSEDVRLLEARGVDVRSVPGAAHTLWYSHFDEFCAALPEVFTVG
ncbi:alpha/beta fold hydrolase [Microbacterium sp.]|uniref:alpha/beta fold hydrolase n=1 Tax=Microbacterium sp. TaxID=51671 RepID=UPI002810C74E|nr:alpha/beta fold hydrolase [Microbacterium sp.]